MVPAALAHRDVYCRRPRCARLSCFMRSFFPSKLGKMHTRSATLVLAFFFIPTRESLCVIDYAQVRTANFFCGVQVLAAQWLIPNRGVQTAGSHWGTALPADLYHWAQEWAENLVLSAVMEESAFNLFSVQKTDGDFRESTVFAQILGSWCVKLLLFQLKSEFWIDCNLETREVCD